MKKLGLTLILVLGFAAVPAFALNGNVAIGPVFSYGLGTNAPLGGLGITGKLPGLPPIFGLNFSIGSQYTFVGLTADWYLFEQSIYAPANLGIYVGPGFFGDIYTTGGSGQTTTFDVGLRVPVGLSWTPLKVLEVFGELGPAVGVSAGTQIQPTWRVQAAVGARFWF